MSPKLYLKNRFKYERVNLFSKIDIAITHGIKTTTGSLVTFMDSLLV